MQICGPVDEDILMAQNFYIRGYMHSCNLPGVTTVHGTGCTSGLWIYIYSAGAVQADYWFNALCYPTIVSCKHAHLHYTDVPNHRYNIML